MNECAQPPNLSAQHGEEPFRVLPSDRRAPHPALSCVPVLCPSRAVSAARTPRSPPRGSSPSSLGPRQSLCLPGLSNHVGGAPQLPAGFMSTQLFSPKPQWCPRHILRSPPSKPGALSPHGATNCHSSGDSYAHPASCRSPPRQPRRWSGQTWAEASQNSPPLHHHSLCYPRPRRQATCLPGLHAWSQVGMVSGQVFPSACPQSL